MKKTLAFVCACLFGLAIVGCPKPAEKPADTDATQPAATETEAAPAAEEPAATEEAAPAADEAAPEVPVEEPAAPAVPE